MNRQQIFTGDCRAILPTLEPQSVQCCVTSPPYWGLRDYGVDGQMGLEETPDAYITRMIAVFREVWRVLRDDGTLWVNMGDSYAQAGGHNQTEKELKNQQAKGWFGDGRGRYPSRATSSGRAANTAVCGLKPKDLCMIPARVALALQADGWYLRSDIIWHKPNPMPESVLDRPTKAHEYIFLLTRQERYYYDSDAIREPHTTMEFRDGKMFHTGGGNKIIRNGTQHLNTDGPMTVCGAHLNGRNKRSVWTIPTQPYAEAHFATFPEEIPKLCILASSKPGDTILDPFAGSGTTGKVALELGRRAVLIELNPDYIELARERTFVTPGFL